MTHKHIESLSVHMKNPFTGKYSSESKLKISIWWSFAALFIYVSIIIWRFTALTQATFYIKYSTTFFSRISFNRLISLFRYFLLHFIFLFYRTVLFFASIYRWLFLFLLQICHRIDAHNRCRTLSRFDFSLVLFFYVLCQFNGYFLLILIEFWKLQLILTKTEEHKKSKSTKCKLFSSRWKFAASHFFLVFAYSLFSGQSFEING